jgi:hypothetical protein
MQAQDELVCNTGHEYPNFQWVPPQGQCQGNFLQDREGFPRYHLQQVAFVWLPFRPSGDDIGPGESHTHEALFLTNPALHN